jgi:hypothetical protein
MPHPIRISLNSALLSGSLNRQPRTSQNQYHTITSVHEVAPPDGIHASAFSAMQQLELEMFGPEDAESEGHYRNMLAFNDNEDIRRLWGPAQYSIIFARPMNSTDISGAIIPFTMILPQKLQQQYGIAATTANQFTFTNLDKAVPTFGVFHQLIAERERQTQAFLAAQGHAGANCAIFHEIADPLLLTLEQHQQIRHSKKYCPFKRIITWADLGQRRLDIPYVIIKTTEGIPARHHYGLHINTNDPVPAELIEHHVKVSTAICYRDGEHPGRNPEFATMHKAICAQSMHTPYDPRPLLARVKPIFDQALATGFSPDDLKLPLRQWLRREYPHLVLEAA